MSRACRPLLLLALVVGACGGPEDDVLRRFDTPGGARVEVLAEGSGAEAAPGTHLTLAYRAFREAPGRGPEEVDETGPSSPFFATLGAGEMRAGLEEALAGMRDGERRRVRLADASAEAGETLVYEIERLATPGFSVEVLSAGEGTEARSGARVTASIRLTLAATGETVETGAPEGGPLTFTLARGANGPLEGLLRGMLGMRVGERRRIALPAVLGAGVIGRRPAIPPEADLVADVTLLAVD